MVRSRPPRPIARRTEARLLIPGELVAALSRRPLDLAQRYIDAWLEVVPRVVAARGPIVCDWYVIGSPDPRLLEVVAELRSVRRAAAQGDFDDEEEHWYEVHGDDAEPWEPPTIPERVIASLAGRRGIGPLATSDDLHRLIARRMRVDRSDVIAAVEICMTFESLVARVADFCRVGGLVVADGRLASHRRDDRDWAV